METESDLLLALYRGAREMQTADFQAFAISLLQPVMRFQSAVWGAGYLKGPSTSPSLVPIQAAMLDIDPDAFVYWKAVNRADKVIPRIITAPGTTFNFHAPTLFGDREDKVMRDYAKRFGRQSYLVTSLAPNEAPIMEWASFYRPDPHDQFTEAERSHCQRLVRHLTEALRVNQLLQGTVRAAPPGLCRNFAALVDEQGLVLAAEAGFLEICQGQWREFDSKRLPALLMGHLRGNAGGTFVGGRATFSARRIAEYLHVMATATRTNGTLSARELEVSTLFASGLQAKEIARMSDVSTSTVRNQLIASYRALGVTDRKGLRQALARSLPRH